MGNAETPTVSLVIPTLGRSPHLSKCLDRLRASNGLEPEIIVVAQGGEVESVDLSAANRVIRSEENLGFAGGCNLGLANAEGSYVGLVNDDALVDPEWLPALVEAIDSRDDVGAVQGINLQMHDPERVDGCGIAWNWAWRPVQLGFGAPVEELRTAGDVRDIFGVSGTAALFRRAALDSVAIEAGIFFDPRLRSYYEDVELAIRLRQQGYRSLLVPEARAVHAGSVTSRQFPVEHAELLSSNRYLVAARLFGRKRRSPMWRLRIRDLVEFLEAIARGHLQTSRGLLAGWKRARRLLPEFTHEGPPALDERELATFRISRASAIR